MTFLVWEESAVLGQSTKQLFECLKFYLYIYAMEVPLSHRAIHAKL